MGRWSEHRNDRWCRGSSSARRTSGRAASVAARLQPRAFVRDSSTRGSSRAPRRELCLLLVVAISACGTWPGTVHAREGAKVPTLKRDVNGDGLNDIAIRPPTGARILLGSRRAPPADRDGQALAEGLAITTIEGFSTPA